MINVAMSRAIDTMCASLRRQRAEGPAAVLAIGTANPSTVVSQDEFADLFFRVTNREQLTDLRDKLKRICKQAAWFSVLPLLFSLMQQSH